MSLRVGQASNTNASHTSRRVAEEKYTQANARRKDKVVGNYLENAHNEVRSHVKFKTVCPFSLSNPGFRRDFVPCIRIRLCL